MTEKQKPGNKEAKTEIKELKTEVKVTQKTKTETKPRKRDETNVIFIGDKPFMNYVTGVVMQFNTKGENEVVIKARGKWIARAVDVEQVAKNKFLKEQNVQTKDIKTGSEEFENKEGRKVNVSTIEITLAKKLAI